MLFTAQTFMGNGLKEHPSSTHTQHEREERNGDRQRERGESPAVRSNKRQTDNKRNRNTTEF